MFDRESIYLADDGHGYKDEAKRNIAFQTAVLEWLINYKSNFDLFHLHDHMTGLIPFFIKHGERYKVLESIPTVFTIHNGSYRGEFIWDEVKHLLPEYDETHGGLLDWDGKINSLATAVKCSWSINTVSPSYMKELISDSDSLIPLYQSEIDKCSGILNGIDTKEWDPKNDKYLTSHLDKKWKLFKSSNKSYLQNRFGLIRRRPLFGFIGRFAHQKGADILIEAMHIAIERKLKFTAVILGSGEPKLEQSVKELSSEHPRTIGSLIAYNETLARHIYAGSDYLLMPSRFEPCGLNQLYSMRYGTIPMATHVGGLKDTVRNFSQDGEGFVIKDLTSESIYESMKSAVELFKNKKEFNNLIQHITELDYSWNSSAELYSKLYMKLI